MVGYRARKALGQHFLSDPNILRRIVEAAGPLAGQHVLEVGPGPGGLTRAILDAGPAMLTAIDADPRSIAALRPLAGSDRRLRAVEGDALSFDPAGFGAPVTVIANLPYNVGTELLLRWLARLDAFRLLVLMFQREVALRLVAGPGTAHYGRLGVLVQSLCHVDRIFDLAPGAFAPAPKVWSSVVRLTPRDDRPAPPARRLLEAVTRAGFGQRRKMLRASLGALGCDVGELLRVADIEPTRRAETLTLDEFARLAGALGERRAAQSQSALLP